MTGSPADGPRTPYVGLVPYGEDDADFFFGRDGDRWIVAGNLRTYRLTILYGPSGVGKTSLLQAGVVPDLRRRDAPRATTRGARRKPVAVCTFRAWQDDPLPPFMHALREAAAEALGGTDLRPWERGEPVVETLRAWTGQLRRMLVVLDQFEDYFLYRRDGEDAGTFGREFPALLNAPDLRVNVLISIREDAWAKLDRFEGRVPHLFANYVRVDHLSRSAAREAIERPVEEWNRRLPPDEQPYSVADALVEAVTDAAASGGLALTAGGDRRAPVERRTGQVEVPFLQLVMERLWRATVEAGSHELTLATLERLGGAQQIVENHLLEALGALTPAEQAVAADCFRFLVTSSRTKIAHSASDLAEWTGRAEPEVSATLEKLCRGDSGRVLRPVTPAAGTDAATRYEFFHDVLAGPILDWRRTYEQERARRAAVRRFARIGAVLLSLTVVFAALGLWALVQRNDAKRATRSAVSLALAAAANEQLADHADESLLLGLEAYRSRAGAEAAGSMTEALESARRSGVEAIVHTGPNAARDVAFSPDGRTIASGGFDGSIRLWDVVAHRSLGPPIAAHSGEVWGVAFSPDGRTLASAGLDGNVLLWDAQDGSPAGGPTYAPTNPMRAVAFSHDGSTLAFAGDDGAIRLWDIQSGSLGPALRGGTQPIVAVAFGPDGRALASAGFDGAVRLWTLKGGHWSPRGLEGTAGEAFTVAFAPDGRTLAAAGEDGTIRLWDARDGHKLGTLLDGRAGEVWSVAFSPDGGTLAGSGSDGTVRLWSIGARTPGGRPLFQPLPPLLGHSQRVVSIAFGPDGDTLAASGYDDTVRLWNLADRGSSSRPLRGHTGLVRSVAFSPDGTTLASGGDDETVRVWDVRAPRPTGLQLDGQAGAVESLAFSPDGSTLASAGHDGPIRLWDVATHRPLRTLPSDQGTVESVAFSPDSGTLASAGDDGTVRLWDAASGEPRGLSLRGQGGRVWGVAFSPDGHTLASVDADGSILLRDLREPKPVAVTLDTSDDVPVSVAFGPDGRTLAVGRVAGSVQLWDVRSRSPLGQPLRDARLTDRVETVAFSPNGRVLAAGSADGKVRLWDVAGHKQLGPALDVGEGAVLGVAFSPDGLTIATVGPDPTVRLWTGFLWRDLADLQEQVCGLVLGNLTRTEWSELVPGVRYRTTCAG